MNIQWLGPKEENSAITIYPTYIIFNKAASLCLEDAYRVLVGICEEDHTLIIKKVSRDEVNASGEALKTQYQTIVFTKSYSRITGKHLIDRIKEVFNLDFINHPTYKYKANYLNAEKMIVVKMEEQK